MWRTIGAKKCLQGSNDPLSISSGQYETHETSNKISRVSVPGTAVLLLTAIRCNAEAAKRFLTGATPDLDEIRTILDDIIQDGGRVMVAVRDSGTGIDKNDMDRLFEPFFTTKADGLGMGLPISRRIINAHGGMIGAENNQDGGASFYLPFQ
jgi:signal transduction histidine kinase